MKFSAVILAGGKSSRMGRDKALLEVDGQPLLARQIQLAREAGAVEIFISARPESDYAVFGCPTLRDRFTNAGPLAGIECALQAATHRLVLVLAVDMPKMNAAFLRRLAGQSVDGCGVITRLDEYIEPLGAFYPKAAADLSTRLLSTEFNAPSVKHFAEHCVSAGLAKFVDLPGSDIRFFTNWNSPTDVASLGTAA